MANKDNPKKGAEFEKAVASFLDAQRISIKSNYPVSIGVGATKRNHRFDLGSDIPKTVIECKAHTWTENNNAPSAKMATWNEAMYYFSLVPNDYRKMFFVLLNRRNGDGETLATYYIRSYSHLIAHGVEIWEFDSGTATHLNPQQLQLG
jgi:hypothetical protein